MSTNSCPGGPTVFPSPSLSQLRERISQGTFTADSVSTLFFSKKLEKIKHLVAKLIFF